MERVLLSKETVTKLFYVMNALEGHNAEFSKDELKFSAKELSTELEEALINSENEMQIVWSTQDVIARHRENNDVDADDAFDEIFPDGFTDITIEQARQIISEMDHDTDANSGTTWATIDWYLEQLEEAPITDSVQLVVCRNCETTFIDTNPNDQPFFTVEVGKFETLPSDVRDIENNEIIKGCPTCRTDGYLQDVKTAEMITYNPDQVKN